MGSVDVLPFCADFERKLLEWNGASKNVNAVIIKTHLCHSKPEHKRRNSKVLVALFHANAINVDWSVQVLKSMQIDHKIHPYNLCAIFQQLLVIQELCVMNRAKFILLYTDSLSASEPLPTVNESLSQWIETENRFSLICSVWKSLTQMNDSFKNQTLLWLDH